ncbi:cytokine-dependent hematopoietic cell linker [Trichomycterus rosablanca]|uniref:cytokine-dependent hematopoietic cell linker n=1 Tax=Trichomycterus rosablanca TaxID=2290929 RepID=UPI002F35D146
MDRWNRGGGIKQRPDHHVDSDEGDYHEPQEPVIHYPRPNQTPEYADRRPTGIGTQRGDYRKASDVPKCPPKRPPGCAPPSVNRNLKPGRGDVGPDPRRDRPGHTDSPPRRPQPTTPSYTAQSPPHSRAESSVRPLGRETVSHFRLPPGNRADTAPITGHRACPAPFTGHRADTAPITGHRACPAQRHSLDLESHELDRRSDTDGNSERDSLRMKHHEWPQVKGEAEQNSYTGHSKPVEASEQQDWYVGAFSRVEAEHALHLVNREGAFLVRDCSRNTTQEPFVLALFYDNRVFNIQIRFCNQTCKYSLGTRVKTHDKFDSVSDIIKFHSIFPIVLIDGRNPSAAPNPKRQCVLMYPVTSQDMNVLLNTT